MSKDRHGMFGMSLDEMRRIGIVDLPPDEARAVLEGLVNISPPGFEQRVVDFGPSARAHRWATELYVYYEDE